MDGSDDHNSKIDAFLFNLKQVAEESRRDVDLNYDSDKFFIDSEDEEMKNSVESHKKADSSFAERLRDVEREFTQKISKNSHDEFEYWEHLPPELREIILDKLDFETWLNFMICREKNKGIYFFPSYPYQIKRFSFYSNVIQEGSTEKEHIRIRVHDGVRALMVKIRECDGYCKFSWNVSNKHIGSVNISNCGYLKVAERLMETLFNPNCRSFKFVVNKNKTEKSAQSVSKWPYFHSYLKKCLGIENYDRNLVDEKFILDFIYAQNDKPVEGFVSSDQLFDETMLQASRRDLVLKLPDFNSENVCYSSLVQFMDNLGTSEFYDENEKRVYYFGYCSVSRFGDDAIKICTPVTKEEVMNTHVMNICHDCNFE